MKEYLSFNNISKDNIQEGLYEQQKILNCYDSKDYLEYTKFLISSSEVYNTSDNDNTIYISSYSIYSNEIEVKSKK